MAFPDSNLLGALTNAPSSAAAVSPLQVQLVGAGDDEPQEVVIENVGFLALNGDTKVKIFARGYESDSLPLPSVSLFSIASGSGLFAAAMHSDLIIGSTSALREAFTSTSEGVASHRPQLSLSLPARISHVVFTSDESHLVLGSASGGLAVYSVSDLNSNSNNPQALFQLGTNGVGLREVKPNRVASEFVAIVTTKGDVQMLNLNTRAWEQGSNGSTLKSNASTVCWSQRGKQIVCGMGDGTMWQMTPQGEGKAVLPSVPGLDNHFVSSIIWLENHLFITTHTPVPSDVQNNESVFHILTRTPNGASIQYTRLPDPVPPFGMEARSPPYFFHVLIKQYAPSMKDMVIFSNTCSSDIGLVSRFYTSISGEPSVPADTWCTTTIGDDTRRAQLPLSGESFQDTSSIGMALDLSSKDNVKRPVGGEEIEESPGPLPVLMVLNHEGLLCAWHVIYNDAIEQSEKYAGMMVYAQQAQPQQQPQQPQQQQQQQQQPSRPSTPPRPTSFAGILGSPSSQQTPPTGGLGFGFGGGPRLGAPESPFASPAAAGLASPGLPTGSVFGTTSNLGSPFGKPSFGSATFGRPSTLGASAGSAFGQSSWGTASSSLTTAATSQTAGSAFSQASALGTKPAVTAFRQPSATGENLAGSAFGQTSVLGAKPAFGTPTALGTGAPAFGAPTALGMAKPTGSAFGQPSALGAAAGSVFGSGSTLGGATGAGGFGSYVNKGGFSAVTSTATSTSGTPIWGTGKTINTENTPSVFGTESTPSAFGDGITGFKISSAFKPDGTATDDNTNPATGGGFGAFGTGLGDALGAAQSESRGITSQGLRDADMGADSDVEQDKASDDGDGDIFTPGARQQDGPAALPKPATVLSSTESPFVAANKAVSSPFGTPTTAAPSSPFGQLGKTPISTSIQQSAFSNWKQTATPFSKQGSPFGTPAQARDNPFNSTPPKATNNPFSPTPTAVANNPFGTPTGGAPAPASPFSLPDKQIVSAFGLTRGVPNKPSPSPSACNEPSPDEAPLPLDLAKAKANPADEMPDPPLPPDFITTKPVKIEVPDAPLPPDPTAAPKKEDRKDTFVAEYAQLPPDFTAKPKQLDEEDIPTLPKEGLEEGGGIDGEDGYEDGYDEGHYDEEAGGEDEEEEQNEEGDEDEDDDDEDDEDEDEDEEEEEEDDEDADQSPFLKGVNITPPKGGLFSYDLKPKTPQSVSPGSSVFGSATSYQDTIGDRGIKGDAPFASLLGSKPGASSDKDHGKPAAKPSGGSLFDRTSDPKKGSPGAHGHTLLGRDKGRKSGSGMGGKATKKNVQTIGRTPSSVSAQAPGGSFFPSPTPIPAPAASSSSVFSPASNKPAASPFGGGSSAKPPAPAPSSMSGKPVSSVFASANKMQVPPPPTGSSNFASAVKKPVRSSPLAAGQPQPPRQQPPQQQSPWQSPRQSPQQKAEQKVEELKEESDLDLDKEFSDCEDEKIRRKLVKGKVKPLENLPKFKSIGEVEVANDFNAVFDSIYLSGNTMVNRLGLTVRGLQAYHMSQNQPLADMKHEGAKDMKQPKDWKLCELQKVGKILDELLIGVMKENKGNRNLEAMYEAANKGFIKYTKDAEIKRFLAVHNDAQTAATARARPLTPEQLLQQRKLRKEYTRVEKLLKDAEKEVTQLKAKIASRDKSKAGAVVPPTVEAVRNTIMKLTGMVERKTGDIEYLEERVRRLKLKSRSASATPSRTRGMTPERSMREETPQRFGTPERTLGASILGAGYGFASTPVLALTDPVDVAEVREEMKARKEMGKKLKGVLERNGPRMTGGQQGQEHAQGQWGQSFRSGR